VVAVAADQGPIAAVEEDGFGRSGLGVADATVPAGRTSRPAMVKIETVPSARLATRASLPSGLIETPEAPCPACKVATTRGGPSFRAMTLTLSSGPGHRALLGRACGPR
jgi:hypothetical protein